MLSKRFEISVKFFLLVSRKLPVELPLQLFMVKCNDRKIQICLEPFIVGTSVAIFCAHFLTSYAYVSSDQSHHTHRGITMETSVGMLVGCHTLIVGWHHAQFPMKPILLQMPESSNLNLIYRHCRIPLLLSNHVQ